jgi:serine protease Do
MRRQRSSFYAGWLAGFAAALILLALVLLGPPAFLDGAPESPEHPDAEPATAGVESHVAVVEGQRQDLSGLSQARQTPIVEATHRVVPSVVSVNVLRREQVRPRSIFDWVPFGYEREVQGLGSGFAIASGGYVLTNAHVVQGAIEIVVATVDGSDYPAEIVGSDDISDLALLKVDSEILVPEFGDSDGLVTGEPAIAIGNPLGYLLSNVEPTVTVGVISGVGRHILSSAYGSEGQSQGQETVYADMIQTDASINPGNSGGPLVDAEGRVIGVNSTIFSRSGGSQGLGFAIPINRALRIAGQLRDEGRVRRPWTGIEVAPAESDRTGRRRGAIIVRVAADSPAEDANLNLGEELVAVRGRPVRSHLDWEAELFNVSPGETLSIRVRDDAGRERDVILRVEDLPSVSAARVEVLTGLELVSLTEAIRAERGLYSREGALIAGVSDRVTQVTGLRAGDLIVQINRSRVGNAAEVGDLLDYLADRGGDVAVRFERGGYLRWTPFFRVGGSE